MRFLADENFPRSSVVRLRDAGHDVAFVAEDSPSMGDPDVLDRAIREGRILLTLDRDYGELVYRRGLSAPPGVLYFRFTEAEQTYAERLLQMLSAGDVPIIGHFTVLTRTAYRQRLLPGDDAESG